MHYENFHIPLEHFFNEDEEIRQIKEKQRIKKLKKQIHNREKNKRIF